METIQEKYNLINDYQSKIYDLEKEIDEIKKNATGQEQMKIIKEMRSSCFYKGNLETQYSLQHLYFEEEIKKDLYYVFADKKFEKLISSIKTHFSENKPFDDEDEWCCTLDIAGQCIVIEMWKNEYNTFEFSFEEYEFEDYLEEFFSEDVLLPKLVPYFIENIHPDVSLFEVRDIIIYIVKRLSVHVRYVIDCDFYYLYD